MNRIDENQDVKNMMKELITIEELYALFYELRGQFGGLDDIFFLGTNKRLKRTIGRCGGNRLTKQVWIDLNHKYLKILNKNQWTEVIIHELCHAYQAKNLGYVNHDLAFKKSMLSNYKRITGKDLDYRYITSIKMTKIQHEMSSEGLKKRKPLKKVLTFADLMAAIKQKQEA